MASPDKRSFTFIPMDWRSKPAQEAIRVHIMRDRHRQARRGRRIPQARTPQGQFKEQLHFWKPREDQNGRSDNSPTPRTQNYSWSDGSPQDSDSVSDPGSGFGQCVKLPLPLLIEEKTMLADLTCGINPSSTDQGNVEEMLLQHYLRYGGGSQITHQFLRAFCETMGTFNAFLAIIATNYSDEQGQNPLLDTAELENIALQEVSTQISHSPTAPAYSTMVTVAMLANLRECRHEMDLVDFHWSALKQMVDINGGINRLRINQDLYAFLLLIEAVVLSTTCSIAQLPEISIHVPSMQLELQDFLGIIRRHLRTVVNTKGNSTPRLTSPVLTTIHRPSHKTDPYSISKWRKARFACILFFSVLDLQSKSPLQDDLCYRAIESEVLDRGRKYIVYPQELYFVIARVTNQDSLCELTWKTMRLICAVKQLCQRDINTCYRLLTAYLGIQDPFELTMLLDEWDELSSRVETLI